MCGVCFFCWRAAKRRRNRRRIQSHATTFPTDPSQVSPGYNIPNKPPATTIPIETSQVPPGYNISNQPPATTIPMETSQVLPVYNQSNLSPIKPPVVSETEFPEPSPEDSVSQLASTPVVTQSGTEVEPPDPPHRIDDGVSSQPNDYEDLFPADLGRGIK
jgi:hypothetical protein